MLSNPEQYCAVYRHRNASHELLASRFKAAALFFDRIWGLPGALPEDVLPSDLVLYSSEVNALTVKRLMDRVKPAIPGSTDPLDSLLDELTGIATRIIVDSARKRALNLAVMFSHYNEYESDEERQDHLGYRAVLENMPLVEIGSAPWEQVLEFRADRIALERYRAMRRWLTLGAKASDVDDLTETLQRNLEDYEWALRKHGIQTARGVFELIVSPSFMTKMTVGAAAGTLTGSPVLTALLGGGICAGTLVAHLANRYISKQDLKRGVSNEVAIIAEIKKEFEG